MLEGACQCALSQLSLKIRRGKAPDDAFEEWIWGLASLFHREFGKPTSSWSKETKSRYTPFVTFVSKLYAVLPAEQAGPSEAALEEKVHRALTRRQNQKVKKGS